MEVFRPRKEVERVLVPLAKKLQLDLAIKPGAVEAVELSPRGKSTIFLPSITSYPAAYHELGHVLLTRKRPWLSRLSDYTFPLTGISPLLAFAYLLLARRKVMQNPVRHGLIALGLWKLPNLPLASEELLATITGARVAKKYQLPEAKKAILTNLPFVFTYLY